jgi:hypothetical protein
MTLEGSTKPLIDLNGGEIIAFCRKFSVFSLRFPESVNIFYRSA